MNRREALQVMGITAAGVAALVGGPGSVLALQHERPTHADHFAKCAKACADCLNACEVCFRHCVGLVAEGRKDHLPSLNLCVDCGDTCAVAARISARQGSLAVAICEACANACDVCAVECEKFPQEKHMADCAQACRECAKACRELIHHLKG
jgi:hypothetical protein